MPDVTAEAISWVDELVARLNVATGGVLQVQIGGETVSAVLGHEVIQWLKDNKSLLIRLGKDTFRSFLILIHEKRQEDAFHLLLTKMSADDIIARLTMDAAELKNHNDLKDEFVASLTKFALTTLTSLASKVIVGLLL